MRRWTVRHSAPGARAHFDDEQIVELTLRTALCGVFNRVNDALQIESGAEAVDREARLWTIPLCFPGAALQFTRQIGKQMAEADAHSERPTREDFHSRRLPSDPFPGYEQHDAIGLGALVRNGDVAPLDLLEAAAARLEARNPALNAVVSDWLDRARTEACQPLPDGPFHGVPFILKDLGSEARDTPLTMGSRFFAGNRVERDGEIVSRFRAAGLVPFGRGNAPEFGISATTEPLFHGPTRNPWNLAHTPGGSSGGAAAAVAAGIVPMAYASDGGGSTRIPASCCGLVGMKPSRGHSPVVLGAALGQELVVSRTVRDTAAALDAVSGPDTGAPFSATLPKRSYLSQVSEIPRRLTIAVSRRSPHGDAPDPACVAAVESAAALCEDLGHIVVEAEPVYDFERLAHAVFKVMMATRTAAIIAAREKAMGRGFRADEIEPYTRAMAEIGRRHSAMDYAAGFETLDDFSRRFAGFFIDHDVLLTPTLGRSPLPLGTLVGSIADADAYLDMLYDFMPFTMQFNASGMPAISLPLHWSEDGLPIGAQFGARRGDDATLIRLAGQLESAAPWFDRRPPMADGVQ